MASPQPSRPCSAPGRVLRFLPRLAVTLLATLAMVQCGPQSSTRIEKLVPGFDPRLARAIERHDPDALSAIARDEGQTFINRAYMSLIDALPDGPTEFAAAESVAVPAMQVLAGVLETEFHFTIAGRSLRAYARYPIDERRCLMEILQRYRRMISSDSLSVQEKVAAIESSIKEALPYADVISIADLYSGLVELLPRVVGRDAEMPTHLNRATDFALAFGDTTMACQFLGMLGVHYYTADVESLRFAAWDRALTLARTANSWQEARIYELQSGHHSDKRDVARALELLTRAETRSRELGAEQVELRFVAQRLMQLSSMGAWDMVDRGLDRADVLIRRGRRHWSPKEESIQRVQLDNVRMRMVSARGEREQALALARSTIRRTREIPPPGSERYVTRATFTIAQFGFVQEAISQHEASRKILEENRMMALLWPNALAGIEIYTMAGDTAMTAAELERFAEQEARNTPEIRFSLVRDLRRVQFLRKTKGEAIAMKAFATSMAAIESHRERIGPTPEDELYMRDSRRLRQQFHDVHAGTPGAGYAFELAWPRLAIGTDHLLPAHDPSRVAELSAEGQFVLPRLDGDIVHCIYFWGETELVRWTRDRDAVRREVVTTDTRRLRARLEALHRRLGGAEGRAARLPRGLTRELSELAVLLLPAEMLDPADSRRLLVQRDGPLALLPFEALGVSRNEYQPLVGQRDVVYGVAAGRAGPHQGRKRDPALDVAAARHPLVVVAAPAYDKEDVRRLSVLEEDLPFSQEEALAVAANEPNAIMLTGSAASRDSVRAVIETADRIYVSAHVVQDPEFTYRRYIPLAPGRDGRTRLDLHDFRGVDLMGCRLTVLSGCESAVRYWNESVELPSLAEAALLAGSRHVIGTLWNVRDDEGARLMHAFNAEYRAAPDEPVGAMTRAKRRLIAEGAPPATWSAYTIFSNEFVVFETMDETADLWTPSR